MFYFVSLFLFRISFAPLHHFINQTDFCSAACCSISRLAFVKYLGLSIQLHHLRSRWSNSWWVAGMDCAILSPSLYMYLFIRFGWNCVCWGVCRYLTLCLPLALSRPLYPCFSFTLHRQIRIIPYARGDYIARREDLIFSLKIIFYHFT